MESIMGSRNSLATLAQVFMCAATAAGVFGVAALAETPSDAERLAQASIRSVCRADFARLCSNEKPGGGRVIACFKEHASELSPECRDGLMRAKQLSAQPENQN
jgi:hypothetical protein